MGKESSIQSDLFISRKRERQIRSAYPLNEKAPKGKRKKKMRRIGGRLFKRRGG